VAGAGSRSGGGEGLPESCCCADRAASAGCSRVRGAQPSPAPAILASGSSYRLTPSGLATPRPPAHTCQAETPQPGSTSSGIRCGPASLGPASRLLFLGGSSGGAPPCCCTPLWERGRLSARGWLSGCVTQGQAGWGRAAPGDRQGLPDRLAGRQPPRRAPPAPARRTPSAKRASHTVLDVSSGAGDPAPLGTGSSHSPHRDSVRRPLHSPVLYQAQMQELHEFLKLVLVSAIFF